MNSSCITTVLSVVLTALLACSTTREQTPKDSGTFVRDSSSDGSKQFGLDGAGERCRPAGLGCEALASDVICCPQLGYAYDFEQQCFQTAKKLVFCYEQMDRALACGHQGTLSCYQRIGGAQEAWFAPDAWTGFPIDVKYRDCQLMVGAAPGAFLNSPYCGDAGTTVGQGPPP
jgi:hypothetical protein